MLKQNNAILGLQSKAGKILACVPISPNHWTLLSVVVAVIAAIMIAYLQNIILGLALFAAAGLLDMVDGAVARAKGETSKLGAFIDGVADRFVEALFLFSFMFISLPEIVVDAKIWMAGLIFTGTCMPSFIIAYADHKKVIKSEDTKKISGILERSERICLIIIALIAGILLSMDYFVYGMILANALSIITIIQRLYRISEMAHGNE